MEEKKDLKGVTSIMMEFMEPDTFRRNPNSISLSDPKKWNDRQAIIAFLKATQVRSLEELMEHEFIPNELISHCLIPHVIVAQHRALRISHRIK